MSNSFWRYTSLNLITEKGRAISGIGRIISYDQLENVITDFGREIWRLIILIFGNLS